jgi:hypoxanthine-guanine phosphoribosyltransferase
MRASTPVPVFTARQIQQAVEKIAVETAAWLDSFSSSRLSLISILEGARPLARDLTRNLQRLKPGLAIEQHSIRVRATEGSQLMEGREFLDEGLNWNSLGQGPVLIVDDLLDSGQTLSAVRQKMDPRAEVKTAVLIQKYSECREAVDFCGLELGLRHEDLAAKGLRDYWLYGYGMDLDGKFRDLNYVAWVEID